LFAEFVEVSKVSSKAAAKNCGLFVLWIAVWSCGNTLRSVVMLVFAYFGVVLIWATTPLAIQWSSHGVSFSAAAVSRMTLAAVIAVMIDLLFRRQVFSHFKNWKLLFAASLGIFPNMPLVYWSAQFIPSGIIAVIFALSPLATGLISWWLLKDNPFTVRRATSLLIAIAGLSLIFYEQWQLELTALWGVLGILASSFLFSFSSVLVKKFSLAQKPPDAFSLAVGALLFSLPGLWLVWWIQDGQIPNHLPPVESWGSILYLELVASLLGAVFFFFVLQRLTPSSVSLITLMTPLLALWLGDFVAHESLSFQAKTGVCLVLLGLCFYTDWSISKRIKSSNQWLLSKFTARKQENLFENYSKETQSSVDRYK
jgi:drug/metabolite transporter (DMT)-like permease